MHKYIKPKVESFSTVDLAESIGPAQAQSISFDVYRGTQLQQEKEYRYCELNDNLHSTRIYTVDKSKEVKNA